VITLGILRPLRSLFRLLTPYFEPALDLLRSSFVEGYLTKKGFLGRAVRTFFSGHPLEGFEFFWSGWNPVLARVTTRPMFRLLGGNRRPVPATALTFMYTAGVVHFLWLVTLVLLAARWAHARDPSFRLGGWIGADANFLVVLGVLCAYAFFGLCIGVSKALRARRKRGREAGGGDMRK
jgi:hypothetical protein